MKPKTIALFVFALMGASCGGTELQNTAPPSTSMATTSTTTTTTTPTAATTTTLPAPLPLPDVDLNAPLVWYGPNMGSVDFPELFSRPELWPAAREQVDVFKFYGNTVSGFPYDIGGDNILPTFVEVGAFAKLHEWGIAVALEAGAVKFFACEAQSWADYTILGIDNIEANGGRVSFVSMDEPLLGGQLVENGQTCGYTIEETAEVVATYMDLVHQAHPELAIGTIETIPPQTADEVELWLGALEAAGAKPAYLHLDVEVATGITDSAFVGELAELTAFAEGLDIPVGFILTADLAAADSDQGYHSSVMKWADSVAKQLGRPTHLVFQSWIGPAPSGLHEMPVNLPDNDPDVYSHTRLILDALEVFG
jgi:hypothetical protein